MSIEKYLISPDISVREAVKKIDEIGKKVVMITNAKGKLLGILTDGDVRKYILVNGDLSASVESMMNKTPVTFTSYKLAEAEMKKSKMVVYPIVDEANKVVDVIFWNDNDKKGFVTTALHDIPVVIMAGGKGTRLYPYTKVLPKPLIPIGDVTISERIINSFCRYGSTDFHFILNYKGNMIKAYFNDVDRDYEVNYVEEKEFLGTGGGLSLLKGKIKNTFFVSNCDILVDCDYEDAYRFHKKHKNKITFICAMKNMTIPYGVISLKDNGQINEITEKPSFSFLTNTGLYLLEPEVLEGIKDNEFIHLPDIAQQYMDKGENIGVYPISEKSWLDMGQLEEMESMLKTLGVE